MTTPAKPAVPLEPLQFSPCPGRLPSVVFWPVVSGYVTIGDRTSKAYMCERTSSTFAKCQDLVDSQAGSVFVAARIVNEGHGCEWPLTGAGRGGGRWFVASVSRVAGLSWVVDG
jgi:hypothetical protein